jgi:hypothetical protein
MSILSIDASDCNTPAEIIQSQNFPQMLAFCGVNRQPAEKQP